MSSELRVGSSGPNGAAPSSSSDPAVESAAAPAATGTREPPPSSPSPSPSPSRSTTTTRGPLLVALGAAVLTALTYSLLGWRQWENLVVSSWDLGIFSQLAQAYSTFSAPIVPIKGGGFNLLGDHFHPLLVLLGPVWAVWPSGLALLVTQAMLFGISAFPLTRLTAERHGTALGALFGVSYGLGWGLQSAAGAQFHEIAFAVPILAFGLADYLRGHVTSAAAWIGLLVFVKEDLGVTVAVFGLILAVRPGGQQHPQQPRRRLNPSHPQQPRHPLHLRRRRLGIALMIWGLAWFALSTFVILPALNPGGQYDYTGQLDSGSLLSVFVPIEKWVTVLMLLLTAGVVGARSSLILMMLPTLAWRFAGDVSYYWGWQWHYSAALMPIAFAALLEVMPRVRWKRWLAVSTTAAVTLVLGSRLPLAWLLHGAAWETTWRAPYADAAMAAVPPGSTVSTDLTLLAPLVPRAEVYWIGNDNPPPDFVLLDLASSVWQGAPPEGAVEWAESRHPDSEYALVFDGGHFQLAERTGPSPAAERTGP